MSISFKDKLKEILINMSSSSFHSHSDLQIRTQILRQTHEEILTLVNEMVPINDIDRDESIQWCRGFEYACDQMLKNLGEVEDE